MGALARGKIFGIKGQPVVKSVYIQAPMNYFLSKYDVLIVIVSFIYSTQIQSNLSMWLPLLSSHLY